MGKNKGKKYWIGIDLGGTKMLTALFNHRFHIVAKSKDKVEVTKGAKHFIKKIEDSVKAVLKDARIDKSKVGGVGIGAPGIIGRKKGEIEFCPNIPFLNGFKLGPVLARKLGKPVVLENDANTGVYGECELGAARGYKDVIGVFLGTGVGGGIVLSGKIHRGASGAAGEIGHMIVDPSGPLCGCGQKGCLETIAGRLAIAGDAGVLAARGQAKYLFKEVGTEVSKIKSGVLADAIAAGDKKIEKLINERAALLGRSLAGLVNFLSPEIIVIGGGITEAMPFIAKEAEKSLRKFAMPKIACHVKVVAAELGDEAIVKGAAKLAAAAYGDSP